jgi:hypothetical protein
MTPSAEITRFLKSRVPVFAEFAAVQLAKLVDGSRIVSYEPNEAIVHYGAEATHFGVVLAGTVPASARATGPAGSVSLPAACICSRPPHPKKFLNSAKRRVRNCPGNGRNAKLAEWRRGTDPPTMMAKENYALP